jgi:phosphatidyl-myo-inositol dimannoside synthase
VSEGATGEKRLRVLHITRNMPPLRGGMERLNLHAAAEMAQEFEVVVIGPRGCSNALPAEITSIEIPAKPLWQFFAGALFRGLLSALRFRPDVVLAGSGLAAPFAWLAARLTSARLVVYVHGLDLVAEHPVYRWFWRPFIRRADVCIANSRHTMNLARDIGVPESCIIVIHPGVELPPLDHATSNFRFRFGLGERPLMLSAGRLVARKGLLEFVENALPEIVARVPEAILLVVGDEAPDLLRGSSAGLGEHIRQRARKRGLERNVCFLGPQDDVVLGEAFRAAEVHVFPVLKVAGDVEGFGMVAVEAAAHGLPTVAFAVGGVPDAVLDGRSGYLLSSDDYPGFAAKVIRLLRGPRDDSMRQHARAFAEDFRWEVFGKMLRRSVRAAAAAPGQVK